MERLLDAKMVMCPRCGNTVQIFDTAELAADLTRLDAYDRMIESGELIWRADVTAKYRAMKERRDV